MKKIMLSVSTLIMLSACSAEGGESPTLIQQSQVNNEENYSISSGIFQVGDKILKDSDYSYYFGGFGGFIDGEGTILSINVVRGENYNYADTQRFNYIFSKDSTFKLKNGIVLKVVDWDLSKNEIRLEQLTTK